MSVLSYYEVPLQLEHLPAVGFSFLRFGFISQKFVQFQGALVSPKVYPTQIIERKFIKEDYIIKFQFNLQESCFC